MDVTEHGGCCRALLAAEAAWMLISTPDVDGSVFPIASFVCSHQCWIVDVHVWSGLGARQKPFVLVLG